MIVIHWFVDVAAAIAGLPRSISACH